MQLPIPFNPATTAPQWKQQIEQADRQNQKQGADVIIGRVAPGAARQNRLILVDANGVQWAVTVGTDGSLTTTKV